MSVYHQARMYMPMLFIEQVNARKFYLSILQNATQIFISEILDNLTLNILFYHKDKYRKGTAMH